MSASPHGVPPIVERPASGEKSLGRFRPRGILARYTFGIVAVAAALALRIVLTPLTGAGAPFVLFFAAMLVTSLAAGFGPALVCLALSLPVAIPRYQLEKRYIRKDRSLVDILLSASVLRGPDGTARYYIVRVEDITARKRADEALRRAVAAREDILAVVAHDLRNPLATILMAASLLERPAPEPERRDQVHGRGRVRRGLGGQGWQHDPLRCRRHRHRNSPRKPGAHLRPLLAGRHEAATRAQSTTRAATARARSAEARGALVSGNNCSGSIA